MVSRGLSAEEVTARRERWGSNRLPQPPAPSPAVRVIRQLRDPLTSLLVATGLLTGFVLHEWTETTAIAAIVVLNIAIAVVQEHRAEAAIAALDRLVAPTARVMRDGHLVTVPADRVVLGDVVSIAGGDRVPADLRVLEGESVAVDESVLTGESLPVDKHAHDDVDSSPVADRPGRLFAGTVVVRGRATGEVIAVGPGTQLGRIAAHLGRPSAPPLVRELRSVASLMTASGVVLAAGAFTVAAVRLRGHDIGEAVIAGVALAVAAVPEGLTAIVTTSLALGSRSMAVRGAIARSLPAVETLGSVSVICCDKTGTLTSGEVAVAGAVSVDDDEEELWLAARRCNDAVDDLGDPIDVALMRHAEGRAEDSAVGERIASWPFDSLTRCMETLHVVDGRRWLTVKGAPEAVLARCRDGGDRERCQALAEEMAREGARVLVLAAAPGGELGASGLRPLGIVGFHDPLRPSTTAAVAAAHRAGIRVVMVTGDHAVTAVTIAREAGMAAEHVVTGDDLAGVDDTERLRMLRDADVVARIDPASKADLVDAHRDAGAVVAMTGDGVNDAPALRRADVGVAVAGDAGTDVARQASDIVLTNGDLGTIVFAIAEGRRIFGNLKHAVGYLVTGNLSEILVVLGSLVLHPDLAVPLLPVQLLWLNLVTDGLPAVALGVDHPPGDLLAVPPRSRRERLLGRDDAPSILTRAALIAGAVLAADLVAVRTADSDVVRRSVVLCTLLSAQVLVSFTVRSRRWSFERGWADHRLMLVLVGGSLAVQIPMFLTEPGRSLLGLAPLSGRQWFVSLAAALGAIAAIDLLRFARWHR